MFGAHVSHTLINENLTEARSIKHSSWNLSQLILMWTLIITVENENFKGNAKLSWNYRYKMGLFLRN